MSICARTALLAALAIVLPQLTLLERAGAPDAGVDEATTSLRLHHAPHPTTETAHTSLPDIVVDRFSSSPFAAPASFEPDLSPNGFQAPATLSWGATPSAPVTLPPSRAPPAIS